MTVFVSPVEAQIIELLVRGSKLQRIVVVTGIPRSSIHDIITRLKNLNVIKLRKKQRYMLNESYEVIDDPAALRKLRYNRGDIIIEEVHPSFGIEAEPWMIERIAAYYEEHQDSWRISRTPLARELGLPRYLINQLVIEMKLEQKPVPEENERRQGDGDHGEESIA